MNKKDWIEYFEAVNGRSPREDELAQALANNEYFEESVQSVENVEENTFYTESNASNDENFQQEQSWAQPTTPQYSQQNANGFQNSKVGKDVSLYTGKLFSVLKAHKNKVIIALVALLALFLGLRFINGQAKTLSDVVNVEYSGYDGDGYLSYNTEDITKAISEYSYSKAGFSGKEAKALANGDAVLLSKVYSNANLSSKYNQAQAMMSTVSYHFDRSSGLSNGEEVVLTVLTNSTEAPVKAETKSFKVEGLKDYSIVKIEDLAAEEGISAKGFDGYGTLMLSSDSTYSDILSTSDQTTGLKNGDTVTIKIDEYKLDELKQDGKTIDQESFDYEIKGLPKLSEISNLKDLLSKNDTYAKSQKENSSYTTYTLERQSDYVNYIPGGDVSTSGRVELVTVYKITQQNSSSTDVSYNYYGYSAYVKKDNSLDLDTASKLNGWGTEDYENMIADLETSGYKEYKSE